MKVSMNWLAELIELGEIRSPDELMAQLVKVGLEEEGSHGFDITGPVLVGEVLEFVAEEQSNGKTIRWCQVQVGPSDIRGIVCGASNFEVGDKVVVSLPGSVLPGNFEIAARKTYGHVSDGMIASVKELGIGDDHDGILVLASWGIDAPVGTNALELLGLDDTAAEINITPDRGYCLSLRGVAREFAHATGVQFIDPVSKQEAISASGFEIVLADKKPIRKRSGCDRFDVLELDNINPLAPTPAWMRARLKLSGMRSISVVVDITNYVMLQLGQPLHAYDAAKLAGPITVRRAAAGETLETLDGQLRKLDPEDLLITDDSGPIGLAGVMGGASTEVSEHTQRVVLEAAHFDPVTIARSARRHKLPSEASKRFERGVDPELPSSALSLAAKLLVEFAAAKVTGVGGSVSLESKKSAVELPLDFASEVVGVDYSVARQIEILQQIGCSVEQSSSLLVTAPSWRPDIGHKTDLVEEIARIDGYHRIPSRVPIAPPGNGLSKSQRLSRRVINSVVGAGCVEVLNYPFLGDEENAYFSGLKAIKLENPMQEEASGMRLSLLPGLLQAAARNFSRGLVDGFLCEKGSVFHSETELKLEIELPTGSKLPDAKSLKALQESIPQQPVLISGVGFGLFRAQQPGAAGEPTDYRHAVSMVHAIMAASGVVFELRQARALGFHPGRCAEVLVGESVIGLVGEISPDISSFYHLPRVAAFELNLSSLAELESDVVASAVHTYPAATQDLSLVVDRELPAGELLATVMEGAGELLESARIVDDYRGENVDEDKKSLTFALRFRAQDRTLTQEEATEARQQAVTLANSRFGAQLRA